MPAGWPALLVHLCVECQLNYYFVWTWWWEFSQETVANYEFCWLEYVKTTMGSAWSFFTIHKPIENGDGLRLLGLVQSQLLIPAIWASNGIGYNWPPSGCWVEIQSPLPAVFLFNHVLFGEPFAGRVFETCSFWLYNPFPVVGTPPDWNMWVDMNRSNNNPWLLARYLNDFLQRFWELGRSWTLRCWRFALVDCRWLVIKVLVIYDSL